MNCHACGAPLAAAARYCPKCGARVGPAAEAAGWRTGLPWAVAGAALGALIAVLALRVSGGGGASSNAEAPPAAMQGTGGGAAAIDISRMSPEERATRLYNRVMTLHSQGKADSAAFFLPMALQAYAMLPAVDPDARYHIGVLDLTAGNPTGALAQADSIRRAVPSHLFAFMLRARALELERNVAQARRAYGDFLKSEAGERALKRPEYQEHAKQLDSFHEQATAVMSGDRSGR